MDMMGERDVGDGREGRGFYIVGGGGACLGLEWGNAFSFHRRSERSEWGFVLMKFGLKISFDSCCSPPLTEH